MISTHGHNVLDIIEMARQMDDTLIRTDIAQEEAESAQP